MTKEVNNKVALKSGIWYVVGDVLFRTIGFLTMPIFTRVLSKAEFGQFNNITSWGLILFLIVSLDLNSSIIRAKVDYEDELSSYSSSILILSTVTNILFYVIVRLNVGFFSDLFAIDAKYFDILFPYFLFLEAYYIFVTYERANYRYKTFTLSTGLVVILVNALSILLVFTMDDKLTARVLGFHLPYILVGAFMYFAILKRDRKIKWEYIKYALAISLPMLPHLISLNILSSSDKVMITQMVGQEANAVYSVAYTISNIMVIIYVAMNKAWAPWFLDTMKSGDRSNIKKASKYYMLLFVAMIFGVSLIGPEIILILGGPKYAEASYVLVPLLVSTIVQFAYSIYLQVEIYEKRLKTVSFATAVAAIVNLGLNFLLIPKYGYVVAGYTTLIGYLVSLFLHYNTVRSMGYSKLVNSKMVMTGVAISIASIPLLTLVLYRYRFIRWGILVIYALGFLYIILKNFRKILEFLKKK